MLEINKLYNMDAINFLKSIDENSVDLIVTSPPYNCGIEYDVCEDNMEWKEYLQWCESWFKECYRILKDDGRMCVNHYINFHLKGGDSQFPLMDFRNIQEKIGFGVHKLIIWEDRTMSRMTAWGSWMSASAPNIQNPYEGILISYKNQWKKINKGESTISRDMFLESVIGIWKLKPDTKSLTKASFPVELPERCIELLTYKNELVVDPFIGSGSTAIAAIKTNRNFIGCDLSQNYINIANQRIDDFKKDSKNKELYKSFFENK